MCVVELSGCIRYARYRRKLQRKERLYRGNFLIENFLVGGDAEYEIRLTDGSPMISDDNHIQGRRLIIISPQTDYSNCSTV